MTETQVNEITVKPSKIFKAITESTFSCSNDIILTYKPEGKGRFIFTDSTANELINIENIHNVEAIINDIILKLKELAETEPDEAVRNSEIEYLPIASTKMNDMVLVKRFSAYSIELLTEDSEAPVKLHTYRNLNRAMSAWIVLSTYHQGIQSDLREYSYPIPNTKGEMVVSSMSNPQGLFLEVKLGDDNLIFSATPKTFPKNVPWSDVIGIVKSHVFTFDLSKQETTTFRNDHCYISPNLTGTLSIRQDSLFGYSIVVSMNGKVIDQTPYVTYEEFKLKLATMLAVSKIYTQAHENNHEEGEANDTQQPTDESD